MRFIVVGAGRAGVARVKALLATPSVASLAGVVSRRGVPLDCAPDAPVYRSVADVPADEYDAAIVCLENEAHSEAAHAAFAAGKHVLMEYPLATSAADAAGMAAAAAAAGRCLHVEHIELMADAHVAMATALRAALAEGSRVAHAAITMSGPPLPPGWGALPFAGVARLFRLWDLLGPLRFVAASLRPAASSAGGTAGLLAAEFVTSTGARAEWREERCAEMSRTQRLVVTLTDGRVLDSDMMPVAPMVAGGPGLFTRDLLLFIARVRAMSSVATSTTSSCTSAITAATAGATGTATDSDALAEPGLQLPVPLAVELTIMALVQEVQDASLVSSPHDAL